MGHRSEADKIREEMAQLRGGLHRDVEGIVESARTLTDYRYYLKHHPWACLAAGAAIGFLVVPSRGRKSAATTQDDASHDASDSSSGQQQGGALNGLLKVAADSLIRAGVSYVGQQASKAFVDTNDEAHTTAAEPAKVS